MPPTLFECINIAFTFIDITESQTVFSGVLWLTIRTVSVFVTFFWLVYFVQISSGSVDEFADELLADLKKRYAERATSKIAPNLLLSEQSASSEKENEKARKELILDVLNEKIGLKIISALVDPPSHDVGHEQVILGNIAKKRQINLEGWRLVDKNGGNLILSDYIVEPQYEVCITLPAHTVELSNKGGSITLFNKDGVKIDEVVYNKADIQQSGNVSFGVERS